jgi:nucleoside-diphosphate-sugar epimerase
VNVFVHGSSAGVYGDGDLEAPRTESAPTLARSDYERSKLEAEGVLVREFADSSVQWVILRPTGIHGPGRSATLAFYRDVQRKKIWMHGPARVIVHPTYVDDLVQVILLVLARKDLAGEVFNVGGERSLLYQQLIEMVAQRLNRRVVQLQLPAGAGRAAGVIERAARLIGVPAPRQLSRLAQPIVNRAVDISKAQRMLGFGPVPLEAGIMDTIDWFHRERLL